MCFRRLRLCAIILLGFNLVPEVLFAQAMNCPRLALCSNTLSQCNQICIQDNHYHDPNFAAKCGQGCMNQYHSCYNYELTNCRRHGG